MRQCAQHHLQSSVFPAACALMHGGLLLSPQSNFSASRSSLGSAMSAYAGINTPSPTAKPKDTPRINGVSTPPSTVHIDSHDFPIRLRIHSLRIVIATTILIGALAFVTYFLIDGCKLSTTDATQLSDSEKEDLLDKYNSYSGGIASIVVAPFQRLVVILVPIFFLCYSTSAILKPDQGFFAQAGPIVSAFVLTWALGQGLNALNVQWDAPSVEYIIVNSDLISSEASSVFDYATSNVTNSAQIAGVLSTDTILRSAIRLASSSSETNCTTDEGILYYIASRYPSIRFGFTLNSWLEYLMPKSIAADKLFSFGMSTNFEGEEIDVSALPSGNANSTAVLLSYATWAAWTHVVSGVDSIETFYNDIYSPNVAEMLTNVQTKMTNISSSPNYVGSVSDMNFSVPDISFLLATFDLSPQVKFEAMTFTLPIKNETMHYWYDDYGSFSADSDYLELYTDEKCNDYACVLPTQNPDGGLQDIVQLLPICMTAANSTVEAVFNVSESYSCNFPSNNSVLVFSRSRYIAAENVMVNNTGYYIGLKNPLLTRQITVGRLSWTLESLDDTFGATCASDSDCNGLHFPLSNGIQHVVVGKENIPKPFTVLFPNTPSTWQNLVIAENQMDTTQIINLIYPPNYPLADGSDEWTNLSGDNCSSDGTQVINDIIQHHMYSKDSVQSAYTAGLFWLFQNAAVKNIEASNAEASLSGVQLDFEGNRKWLSSRVSIPRTSAFITFGGCFVVFILSILVVFGAMSSKVDTITNQVTAHNVAGMRVGSGQYPSLLVRTMVQASGDANGSATGQDINEFEIAEITLRHRTNGTMQSVKIARAGSHSADYGFP